MSSDFTPDILTAPDNGIPKVLGVDKITTTFGPGVIIAFLLINLALWIDFLTYRLRFETATPKASTEDTNTAPSDPLVPPDTDPERAAELLQEQRTRNLTLLASGASPSKSKDTAKKSGIYFFPLFNVNFALILLAHTVSFTTLIINIPSYADIHCYAPIFNAWAVFELTSMGIQYAIMGYVLLSLMTVLHTTLNGTYPETHRVVRTLVFFVGLELAFQYSKSAFLGWTFARFPAIERYPLPQELSLPSYSSAEISDPLKWMIVDIRRYARESKSVIDAVGTYRSFKTEGRWWGFYTHLVAAPLRHWSFGASTAGYKFLRYYQVPAFRQGGAARVGWNTATGYLLINGVGCFLLLCTYVTMMAVAPWTMAVPVVVRNGFKFIPEAAGGLGDWQQLVAMATTNGTHTNGASTNGAHLNGGYTNGAAPAPLLRPKLSELAAQISANAKIVEDYIESQGLPYPSFASDGPLKFPLPSPTTPELQKVHAARNAVQTASKHMYDLSTGPNEMLQWIVWNFNDVSALHVIMHFDIPKIVPDTGDISYDDIAEKTKIPMPKIRQILRYAMNNRIFCEPRYGYVSHTAASVILRDDIHMQAWINYNVEDLAPAATKVVEALEKAPDSYATQDAPFAFTQDGKGFFEYFGVYPEKAQRFGVSMSLFSTSQGFTVDFLAKGYDWNKLPKDATIVDVGGATGFVSQEIAKDHPDFKFIVQDKAVLSLQTGEASIDPALKPRFEYREHDFLTPQPVVGADVYLIRWCLHDWPDKEAVLILKSLVPGLRHGSRVVVNELCLPEPNTLNPWQDRRVRMLDIVMLVAFNAREREESDWRRLFAEADPRLRFDSVSRPPNALLSIIEATFVDE
ncbi:hypothetical protein H072_7779 [Dactylellina haptotyla CBS 200.50]|uniref:O-methyltransferase C-terminal domain-containing protein n=1 Tax=Dactylellina haptotyla (strain CBS 200.50) TaxID=1284197 RepID=S8A6K6_DACHA|nr:hypothetical protein H072_7779 [Dactylellina haptotyla CBS 200.50]